MKRNIQALVILYFLFAFNANATPQIRDELRVYDQVFQINELPLDTYSEIDKIVKEEHKGCSASWRGYYATWEIVHDEFSIKGKEKIVRGDLYLTKLYLDPCVVSEQENLLDYFSLYHSRAKAKWYSGQIKIRLSPVITKNNDDGSVTNGYEALVFTIEKGKVISREIKFIKR